MLSMEMAAIMAVSCDEASWVKTNVSFAWGNRTETHESKMNEKLQSNSILCLSAYLLTTLACLYSCVIAF